LRKLNDLYAYKSSKTKNRYNIDYIIEESKKSWKEFENLKSIINKTLKSSNDFNKELEYNLKAQNQEISGDAYGQPLMEELIIRMERTVSHLYDEVDVMLALLKSRTKNQRYLLASMRGEDPDAEPEEMSELEKKLESGD
jgi:hypothetical protein